ncbi:hypothetical protein J3D43_003761 [Paenibacillus xylanexedens]|uniref:NACHT domain-containing protein n=1 Tax=Paenibacillus xylanexedens TaxID=528191 RepID=UPI0020A0C514|nr:hypothetical protein [Paenibacillus xylanexedens]MCP1425245.1 hypothetical protein [Paenibacillus xylanexedens]
MDIEILSTNAELIQSNIERLVKLVFNYSKDKKDQKSIECGEAFRSYLNNAYEKYSKTKTILYSRESVFIKDIYVSQNLLFKDNQIDTENINNLLKIGNNFLVTGTGGIGKTTFMKNAFLNTILQTNYIPIFIELKDMNDNEGNLKEIIYKSINLLGFGLEKDVFLDSLSLGKFILFLDGFDEIGSDKRERVKKEILELTVEFRANKIIVSSRKSYEFIDWASYKEMDIEPLSLTQAKLMISKLDYEKNTKDRFLKSLESNLYNSHRSFASIPLLLTIMFLTFTEYAEIPEKKHEFYEAAFDALYSKHDATKGLAREKFTKLSMTEFKRILGYISLQSYLDDKVSFNNTALLEYINFAKSMEEKDFLEENYKEDLLKSVCMLIDEGFDKYKFTHRSFQEYFTAKCIEGLDDNQKKEVLQTIFTEKSRSLEQDMVMKTLFDINRHILEKGLFIDILDKFLEEIKAPNDDEMLFVYLNKSFSSINIEPYFLDHEGNEILDAITFTFLDSQRVDYNYLFKFMIESYSKIFDLPQRPITESSDNSIELEYIKSLDNDDSDVSYRYNFSIADSDERFKRFVIDNSHYYLWEIDCLFRIRDKMKDSLSKSSKKFDMLFLKK